jgi:hypothetical protein
MAGDTILMQSVFCAEDWRLDPRRLSGSRNAGLIHNAIGHIGPPAPDFGYIVERNGLPVHYFVSNIYSLKVITNFIF